MYRPHREGIVLISVGYGLYKLWTVCSKALQLCWRKSFYLSILCSVFNIIFYSYMVYSLSCKANISKNRTLIVLKGKEKFSFPQICIGYICKRIYVHMRHSKLSCTNALSIRGYIYFHIQYTHVLTCIIFPGIPIVYILATIPAIMPWENEFRFLSLCHLIGSVAPWCGSFVYHLFMNLERGEGIYYRLLQLDMLGIWISQSFGEYFHVLHLNIFQQFSNGYLTVQRKIERKCWKKRKYFSNNFILNISGAIPMVTATVFCLNWTFKWFSIISYSMLCLWGLHKVREDDKVSFISFYKKYHSISFTGNDGIITLAATSLLSLAIHYESPANRASCIPLWWR